MTRQKRHHKQKGNTMEYQDPNIDYKEILKEVLTRLKAHEEVEGDEYGVNACNTALDYLFYLEDRSQ